MINYQDLFRSAWNFAIGDLYYPKLPDPKIVIKKEGPDFYIEPENWQININLDGIPKNLSDPAKIFDFFRSINHHEISHYTICPYDYLTFVRMVDASLKITDNRELAYIMVNFVSDLIIDKYITKRFKDLTIWRITQIVEEVKGKNPSDFWKVLIHSYELILDISFNIDKLFESSSNPKLIMDTAKKSVDIIKPNIFDSSTWPIKVMEISKILIKFCDESQILDFGTESGCSIPQFPGNEEEYKETYKKFAKEKKEFDSYKKTLRAVDKKLNDQEILRIWYEGRSEDLIEVDISTQKFIGEITIYPEKWHISDPLEELDIFTSLQISPILVPGWNTLKWKKKNGIGTQIGQKPIDVILIMDSSGSMSWKKSSLVKSEYDIALIASFAVLNYVANKGCEFAVINFSNNVFICNWTTNVKNAEDVLLNYQGNGTILPIEEIKELLKDKESVLILLITDAEIQNWNSALEEILNLIQRNIFKMFWITTKRNLNISEFSEIEGSGGEVIIIKNINDLIGMILKKVINTI